MATIVKRVSKTGKVSYLVRIRLKGQPIQNSTFKKLADAKNWATQTEAAMIEGRFFKHLAAQKVTLNDLLTRYIADVLPHKAPLTQQYETRYLQFWATLLGKYSLADLEPAHIAEGRDKLLAQGLTGETVNRYLNPLSNAFTIAEKEYGWVRDNPVKKIRRCKMNQGRLRYLAPAEIERLLTVCRQTEHSYLYSIVLLALATGMRKSEIMTLRWRQIDLARDRILLEKTKNKERRAIPLQGEAKKVLIKLSEEKECEDDLLFIGRSNRPVYIQRVWQQALKQAEIDNFHFHDLRHTTASYLAMNGTNLLTIAEILGHKTLAMVKRYAHLSDEHRSEALKQLDQVLIVTKN